MSSPIFVTGTGTDVGKTWVLVRLVGELRARGITIGVRKPAQSFAPSERGTTDAELLGAANREPETEVCPAHRWYEIPMAPPMAAAALGRPAFTIADLVEETQLSTNTLVEGAGGPRSPLATDGDNVDYARHLGASFVVLVADAGLGTINAVELSTAALSGFEVVTMLNRFDDHDDLHARNHAWLRAAGQRITTTIPSLVDLLEPRLSSLSTP